MSQNPLHNHVSLGGDASGETLAEPTVNMSRDEDDIMT